ncbi:hypothetical protein AMTRI_Chr01g108470 [Amborella trichopoda]
MVHFLAFVWFVLPLLCILGSTSAGYVTTCSGIVRMRYRRDVISLTDFGGIGDGRTLNTLAFRKAIYRIEHLSRSGGTLLYIPPGVWLTGSFNLTSHMTLYLAKDAVIRASQVSLFRENGTIDGQGEVWWNMWRDRSLQFTRPNLIELINSNDIIISNVVFRNSPFWNIHPVYCSNVVIRYVTVLAPPDSPNTDGIDPDSSSNMCIEDSYISTGDDLVAIKSGWDEYGIAYARPSSFITIRRISGSSLAFTGIAFGSETSGGISDIVVENITLVNTATAIFLKTNAGRGGYIRNITVRGVHLENVTKAIKFAGDVGDHPDDKYDPRALPVVEGVSISDVWGVGVMQPGSMKGINGAPFKGICLSNVNLYGWVPGAQWKCTDISGVALGVRPWPCAELAATHGTGACSLRVLS